VKSKIIGFVLVVILIVCGAGVWVNKLLGSDEPKKQVVVEMTISEYGYTLDDRDSKLMKEEFKVLKNILSTSNLDYEEYARSLAKLYIIDLYTISNKVNIYDIPCLEYLLEESHDSFKDNIKNTLYLYLQDNTDTKRNQELPSVKSIKVDDLKLGKYVIDKKDFDSYEVTLSWEYEMELGYDKKALITIIKNDKKLYVVKSEVIE